MDKTNSNCSWTTYKHGNADANALTKYNYATSYGENPDGKTTLDPEDDAARFHMGGDWRMPTKDEFQELLDNTTNEWVIDFNGSGVNGRKFTSKTDKSKYIFIPAAGYCGDGSVGSVGDYGYVWSSSLDTSSPIYAWSLYFYSGNCRVSYGSRYYGRSVRGVRK